MAQQDDNLTKYIYSKKDQISFRFLLLDVGYFKLFQNNIVAKSKVK